MSDLSPRNGSATTAPPARGSDPAADAATIAATRVRHDTAALGALGLDIDALCAQAGLDLARLDDPSARYDAERLNALWRLAARQSANPAIGLAAARAFRPGGRDLVDYMMMSSPNLGSALRQRVRYDALTDDNLSLRTLPRAGFFRLAIGAHAGPPAPPARVEFKLLSVHRFCQWLLGRPLPPRLVEFAHPAPSNRQPYSEAFGCPVRFDSEHDSIHYAQADLAHPLLTSNRQMAALHERLAEDSTESLCGGLLSKRVGQLVETLLPGGAPTRREIAAALHLSDSTLHRRLCAEGVSYQTILDQTRRVLARQYLCNQQLALAEVAFRLGFADCSCLARACQRWFQQSPGRMRHKG